MANKLMPTPARQRGSLIMIFAMALMVLIGFIGMALDLGQVYNRKAELQNIADSAALAAAQELNGSAAGVASALARAKSSAAEDSSYGYLPRGVTLTDRAVSFAASAAAADGDWQTSPADPAQAMFVKVDTSQNGDALGRVGTFFIGALSSRLAHIDTGARAVAGRASLKLTPLAVCAMGPELTQRPNPGTTARPESVEFGFRRGVGYNLLNLNPNGAAPVNYLLNGIDALNATGAPAHVTAAAAAPFVCSGTMPLARIGTARIHAHSPFPDTLLAALNSRFNLYNGGWCHPKSAPPDSNIRAFTGATASLWMNNVPAGPSAAPSVGTPLATLADTSPVPATMTAAAYGPLWSYARTAKYAAVKPAAGYADYALAAWPQLYPAGVGGASAPTSKIALTTLPYAMYLTTPTVNVGLAQRRVLMVPLLECPLPAGADVLARVLAIGKFFMTAPAVPGVSGTPAMLSAEFAGVVAEQSLGGPVELQQ